jgi:hypothetical protein
MDDGARTLDTDRMTVSYSPRRLHQRQREPVGESIVLRHQFLALLRSADDAFLASRGRHPAPSEAATLLGWPLEDVVEARLAAVGTR